MAKHFLNYMSTQILETEARVGNRISFALNNFSGHIAKISEKAMAPHSSPLAWKIHGQKIHGAAKSRTRLSDFTFTFHFHAWEKEMATRSSVRAWRIPETGENGRLPSMGSHRVGHD